MYLVSWDDGIKKGLKMRKVNLVGETIELVVIGVVQMTLKHLSIYKREETVVIRRREEDQVSDVEHLYLGCLELALYPCTTRKPWLSCQLSKCWDYNLMPECQFRLLT